MNKPVIRVLKISGETNMPTDRVINGKLHQEKFEYTEDGTASLYYDLEDYMFKDNNIKSDFNELAKKIISEHPKAPDNFDEKARKKLKKKFESIINEWISENKIIEQNNIKDDS